MSGATDKAEKPESRGGWSAGSLRACLVSPTSETASMLSKSGASASCASRRGAERSAHRLLMPGRSMAASSWMPTPFLITRSEPSFIAPEHVTTCTHIPTRICRRTIKRYTHTVQVDTRMSI